MSMSVLPSPSMQLARSLTAVNVDDVAKMSPLELWQSQLASGSTEASVDAMKRLSVVAVLLGADATVNELIPHLNQFVLQQPSPADELLLLLGQALPKVATLLLQHQNQQQTQPSPSPAGSSQLVLLLPIIERLAAVEETVVRDQAVSVFAQLTEMQSPQAPDQQQSNVDWQPYIACVRRLASADWFTAKVSACGMVAPLLAALKSPSSTAAASTPTSNANNSNSSISTNDDFTTQLHSLFQELCSDETPMVRRAAANHVGKVLSQPGTPTSIAQAMLSPLAHDEQDSVRLLALGSLAQVGTEWDPAWTAQNWLPLVKSGSTDMSWRVRHHLATHFADIAINLGFQKDRRWIHEQTLIMACYHGLLKDVEAEVRAAAVGHLSKMITYGGPQLFASHLQPLLPALADDVVMEVRSKCALALMDSAQSGALDDATVISAFGPLLESFLGDEFQEVQLQVLTHLHQIAHLLPGLSGVVTTLLQMSKAHNWRVRQAVAQLLPHLAEARGLDFFLTVLLEPAWLPLLLDKVACVRQACVSGMGLLVQVAGPEWVQTHLMPHHTRLYQAHAHSYLIRVTLLQADIETAVACDPTHPLWIELVSHLVRAATQDKVPNVRMVSAQGLLQICKAENGKDDNYWQSQVQPALQQRLTEETDADGRAALEAALQV